MPIRAVAFDLDYTLALTERDRETLLAEAVDRAGVPEVTREAYLRAHETDLASETRQPIFETLLRDREDAPPDPEAAAQRLTETYRAVMQESMTAVDGVESLLERLGREYPLGLLTDGPRRAQLDKVRALGWTDHFDTIVVTGTLPAGKPDGRAFQALLDGLGVPAETVAYVGDHPEFDVEGSLAAGLRPIQVLVPGRERHPQAEATVERDRLVTDLPEIIDDLK